ncbi:MAG: DUF362 domain-containing protein [Eubacterium sp.]|nr:DUF362 domain-containing protein [Eubacterium sp.]
MARVALIACDSYDKQAVYEALKRGVQLLGGMEKFVRPEEKILVKPNMLRGKKAASAVTTHPAVVSGVLRLLKEAGCDRLYYGDSPGIGSPEKVAEESGIQAAAEAWGAKLLEFSRGQSVAFPQGEATKSFEIAQGVLDTDAIISVSKMKTHGLTRITGAIKNQLGCVYGFNKGASHARYPDVHQFSRMLVDLNKMLAPRLYIMDGIVAMEGNGPASGTPIPMKVLLMSEDPVALDTVFAHLVDLNPDYVPLITAGAEMGLGESDWDNIEIVGDDFESKVNRSFNVERFAVKSEGGAIGRLGQLSKIRGLITRKPVVIQERCIQCGVCIASCPLEDKALSWKTTGRGRYPHYDYHKCIRCYCCQEMCPKKAITVKTPILGKLLIYR